MKEKAKREIEAFVNRNGGNYPRWYCGIAAKPRDRLFEDHNVDEKKGTWIYRDAGTETAAREVEEYFHKKGCQGSGGGGKNPHYVYAYKITSTTHE